MSGSRSSFPVLPTRPKPRRCYGGGRTRSSARRRRRVRIPTYFLFAEEFLDDLAVHLAASLQTLGVSAQSPDRRPLLDQILQRDAKDPERTGSAEQRAGKLASSRSLHGAAIEAAIRTASARIGTDVESAARPRGRDLGARDKIHAAEAAQPARSASHRLPVTAGDTTRPGRGD
jgi:hypothetical protein